MLLPYRLLAAGLALLPLSSLAQDAPFTPRPYLGAGVSILTVRPIRTGTYEKSPVGPALTGGVQLTPRLAVQASAGLHWQQEASTRSYPAAPTTTYASDEHRTVLTVPVLVRYSFATPLRRLRLDALGGINWQRTFTDLTYAVTDTPPTGPAVTAQSQDRFAYSQSSLSLGPALRYRLQPGFELNVSAPVNYLVQQGYSDAFSDHLFVQVLAGVQYNFGR